MIKIPFGLGAILGPKIERNMKKHSPKNHKKNDCQKSYVFGAIRRFWQENHRNLRHFGIILGPRWHKFSVFFWASVFGWIS